MDATADRTGRRLATLRERARRATHAVPPPRQEDVLGRLAAIAADEASRARLAELRAGGGGADAPVRVVVRIGARPVRIVYPHNWMSYLVLDEVLVERVYEPPHAVPRVFDVGANIGIAALFFHALMPAAEIVCVEPSPYCLPFLEENLAENGVRAHVVRALAGRTTGWTRFYESPPAAHACSSQFVAAGRLSRAPAVAWGELVTGHGYGLKVDAEGAEHDLAHHAQVIAHAAWIVGELHYGAWQAASSVLHFDEVLRRRARVRFGRASVGFAGTIVRKFWARPRSGAPEPCRLTTQSAQADQTGHRGNEASMPEEIAACQQGHDATPSPEPIKENV